MAITRHIESAVRAKGAKTRLCTFLLATSLSAGSVSCQGSELGNAGKANVAESPVDEPMVGESPVDEPTIGEPPVDEPPVDDPTVNEPPVPPGEHFGAFRLDNVEVAGSLSFSTGQGDSSVTTVPKTEAVDATTWELYESEGYFHFVNKSTGDLLGVDELSEPVMVPSSEAGEATQWSFEPAGDGGSRLVHSVVYDSTNGCEGRGGTCRNVSCGAERVWL